MSLFVSRVFFLSGFSDVVFRLANIKLLMTGRMCDEIRRSRGSEFGPSGCQTFLTRHKSKLEHRRN